MKLPLENSHALGGYIRLRCRVVQYLKLAVEGYRCRVLRYLNLAVELISSKRTKEIGSNEAKLVKQVNQHFTSTANIIWLQVTIPFKFQQDDDK